MYNDYSTESLINDQTVASIELSGEDKSEASRIEKALRQLCDSAEDHLLFLSGVAHKLVWPNGTTAGTRFTRGEGHNCRAEVVLAPENDSAEWKKLVYELSGNTLTATFNPTTIIGGTNVSPTAIRSSDGSMPSFPSSSLEWLRPAFRLGHLTLRDIYSQLSNDALYCSATLQRILDGRIHLIWTQFAAYLETVNPLEFLQLVTVWSEQTISDGRSKMIRLSNYFRCEFLSSCDADRELWGVLYRKRHGRREGGKPGTLVFSVGLYDKQRRVGQMNQSDALELVEENTVRDCIRLDITAHSEGILTIVSKARKHLRKLSDAGALVKPPRWLAIFQTEEPTSTVWWLERAICALSMRHGKGGHRRESFSKWLVPYILRDVLRFDVISGFDASGYHRFTNLDHPVARAWRDTDPLADENWAEAIAEVASVNVGNVYKWRKRWLEDYGIDISLPFAFYRDLLFYGPNSYVKPNDREQAVDALNRRDDKKLGDILTGAALAFDKRRRAVLVPVIKNSPRSLPLKLGPSLSTVRDRTLEHTARYPKGKPAESRLLRQPK